MSGAPFLRLRASCARAAVAVQVCVCMVVLIGFGAFVVDVGGMYNVRADLQRTADAAALAAASAYTSDEMMTVRMGTDLTGTAFDDVVNTASQRATSYAAPNPSYGTTTTNVHPGDIQTGWLDLHSATALLDTTPFAPASNAVQVLVRRDGGDEGTNPAVPFLFAQVLGFSSGMTGARATATFDDRFSGFLPGTGPTGTLPMTIHEDAFATELANGGDNYGWNENGGVDTGDGDGIREIRLYPYPLSGAGYSEGDGNFGVLNIGSGNQGLTELRDQITNGTPSSDFITEIGTADLTFYDGAGLPISYTITGSPGLDGGLTHAIEHIVGSVVGFFLHDNVILSGANAEYTIVQMRFGRVMDIKLNGPPHQRGLYIQPVSYVGSDVQIDPEAPSSGGLVGRLVLAR